MEDIVFIQELNNADQTNQYLFEGWKLLDVNSSRIKQSENEYISETKYVIGANAVQYQKYRHEQEHVENAENNIKKFFN